MALLSPSRTMSLFDLMQSCSWIPYRTFKLKVSLIVGALVDAFSAQATRQSLAAHQKVSN